MTASELGVAQGRNAGVRWANRRGGVAVAAFAVVRWWRPIHTSKPTNHCLVPLDIAILPNVRIGRRDYKPPKADVKAVLWPETGLRGEFRQARFPRWPP
jgi:hypothetical protein